MKHRVFVGTLSSGEAEFAQCETAILTQEGVSITHYVVSGMPERQAHDVLWAEWAAAKKHHDLFVKVDADTVLLNPFVIARISEAFELNPRLTGMQLPILDYFTDGPIAGLNAFSPSVEFRPSSDLFCDRTDSNHDLVLKCSGSPTNMTQERLLDRAAALGLVFAQGGTPPVPAARHCFEASDAQAFHFGLHRALKGQYEVMERVRAAWSTARDRRRGLALAGAAVAPEFLGRPADYENPAFLTELARAVKEVP